MTRARRIFPNRVLADDRRNSAMHEAAHYVIAGAVGVRHRGAWITQVSNGTNAVGERSFVGSFIYPTGAMDRLSSVRRMMIGIAGGVGESLWRDADMLHPFWVEEVLDVGSVSDTDWDLIGVVPDYSNSKLVRAGDRVLDLLQDGLHVAWRDAARALMRTGEIWSADGPLMRRMRDAASVRIRATEDLRVA
jgi:hypothetical protein